MNRRGNLITENLIGLLISLVAVGFLIILMIRIFSPTLTIPELTAKNYLEALEVSLKEAKETGSSDFLMYSSEPNPYLLVYFGEGYSFDKEVEIGGFKLVLQPKQAKKENLCVCYFDGEESEFAINYEKDFLCNYCVQKKVESFRDPVVFSSGNNIVIVYNENSRTYSINAEEDLYLVFEKLLNSIEGSVENEE